MRLVLAFCFLATLLVLPLWSALLKDMPMTLQQPDGSILECFASGDEYYNYLHDKDNFTIIQSPSTGFYSYAAREGDVIRSTDLIPGRDDPMAAGLLPFTKISEDEYRTRRETLFQTPEPSRTPTTGTINNIVVFIRFSNQTEFGQSISTYNGWFNTGTSSLKNYFLEASYNQLTVNTTMYPPAQNNLVVSWQDSQPRGYYSPYNASTNTIGYTNLNQGYTRLLGMLENATNGIASHIPSSLNIDADNDGRVDNVVYIVRGGADTWSDVLWPHRWSINDRFVYINGKRVYDYNFQLQDFLYSDNVGVLCHEFFHTLGAPDLYHYVSNGVSPVGSWDLMETNMNPPQHMGAYMKWKYGGWISNLTTISASQTYSLNPLTSATGSVYKINSPVSSEYFVVEFRKKTGTFENSIPASGMLIYRINPSVTGNASGPPDEVYIYRPNGTNTVNGNINQAHYSSETGRTAINQTTNPSPFLTNGTQGGLSISNIGSSAGNSMSFNLIGSAALDPPTNVTASVSGRNVTLNWSAPGSGSLEGWLSWDNGTTGNSVGTNSAANFDVAHRFTQQTLAEYAGSSITQIKFFPSYQDCIYTIKVWTGGTSATNPGTLVRTQVANNVVLNEWNTVTLSSPVAIPLTGELWFGYNVNTQGGYPAGSDTGPAITTYGNVMYFNNAWTTLLALAPTLNYNWLLGAYAQGTRGMVELSQNRISSYDLPGDSHQSIISNPSDLRLNPMSLAQARDRSLTGFKIYRNGTLINTINNPATTTFTDQNLSNGTYTYGVSAVYTGGESSQVNVQAVVSVVDAPVLWSDGFESYPNFALSFPPWTLLDIDQSTTYGYEGIHFPNSGSPMSFIILNPSATTPPITTLSPHSGAKTAASFAAVESANNDWMISPRITLGTQSSVTFWARSHATSNGLERIRVGVSTNSNPLPATFQYLTGTTYVQVPVVWTEYTYDLSSYNNQSVWIGVRSVSDNAFVLYVDDFTVNSIGGSVGNEDAHSPSIVNGLYNVHPNPFNPETTISYGLGSSEAVNISIYNLKGQLIKTMVNETQAAGNHSVVWNGTDNAHKAVSSGIYFCRMTTAKQSSSRKLILMK